MKSTLALALAAFVTGLLLNQVAATPKPATAPTPVARPGQNCRMYGFVGNPGRAEMDSGYTALTAVYDTSLSSSFVVACTHP